MVKKTLHKLACCRVYFLALDELAYLPSVFSTRQYMFANCIFWHSEYKGGFCGVLKKKHSTREIQIIF
jgi:hypothetical protein